MIKFTPLLSEIKDNDIFPYQPTEKEKKEFGKVNAGYKKIKAPKKEYTHCDIYIDKQPFKANLPIPLAKFIQKKEQLSRNKGAVTLENYR